jgi:hypothetical protein
MGRASPTGKRWDRAIKIAQRMNALFGLEVHKVRLGGDEDAPPIKGEMKVDVFADIAQFAGIFAVHRERGGLEQSDLPPHGTPEPVDPAPPDDPPGPLPDQPLP